MSEEQKIETQSDVPEVGYLSREDTSITSSENFGSDSGKNTAETTADNDSELDSSHSDVSSEALPNPSVTLEEPVLPEWICDELDDELNDILPILLRHVKGKRGGDLLGLMMPVIDFDHNSKRRGKLVVFAIIKGEEQDLEWVRIKRRLLEISYRNQKSIEDDLTNSLSMAPFLRKAKVLFERDGISSKICEMAGKRFKQGPPHTSINERIMLKAECYHWVGKMQELTDSPDRAKFVLPSFVEQLIVAWFRLRGLWYVSSSEEFQFIFSRDRVFAEGLRDIWNEEDLKEQLELLQRLASHVLKDIPWPARID